MPSRRHFSPNATTVVTPAIRKNKNALPNSPLSRMSSGSENELSVDDMDEVGMPVSSRPLTDSRLEGLYDCNDPASKSKFTEADAAFTKAFLEMDLDDLDNFRENITTAEWPTSDGHIFRYTDGRGTRHPYTATCRGITSAMPSC